MPLLPVHLGPGLLFAAAAPRRCSFAAFAAAQLLIDVESVANHLLDRWPVHGTLHSIPGAVAAGAVAGLALGALGWRHGRPRWRALATGGILGGLVHALLDGLVHADAAPLWPLHQGNPLLALLPRPAVDLLGLGLGLIGAALYRWRSGRHAAVP